MGSDVDVTARNIFVVDDDTSVRNGVARLLRSAGYQVETYPSAEAFMASRHGSGPGCLVLDIRMPDSTGLDLHERLLGSNSKLAVVFITGHGDIPTSVRAIKNGAIDFLAKPFDDVDLLAAVAQALSKSAHDHAVQDEIDSIKGRLDALTPREREVLGLVVTGMLNKQIADAIGTSEKTVKVHRGRVMEKMRVRSLAELVQISAQVGIHGTRSIYPGAVSSADPRPIKRLTLS
jgi:FixJ family two-component response regulator